MTPKLSPQKIAKMMSLYFQGFSQTQIANKLKVHQSTVSLKVAKLKTLAINQGMKNAVEEYGITDTVEALHSLSVELHKSNLTVEEAKAGLKMELLFQKYGIEQEEYGELIKACKRMKDEGFITAAIKLNQLEDSTGMAYGEIVDHATSTYQELQENQQALQDMTEKLHASKGELADIDNQKKQAEQGLTVYMKQVGVNTNRLKLVEGLALALKAAGIPHKDIQNFIQCQKVLNKAGIDPGTFTELVKKAKMVTSDDGGKQLLKELSEYGGLVGSVNALQVEVKSLSKQAAGLEYQAALKGKLESDVANLKAEKSGLEAYVVGLHSQKGEFDQVKDKLEHAKKELDKANSEINSLGEKEGILLQNIHNLEMYESSLADDIKSREQRINDLKELESKYQHDLAQSEAKLKYEQKRWEIFESFLGFVQATSLADQEKLVLTLPSLLEEVKKGKYSPKLLQGYVLQHMAGPALQVLRCKSCQVQFIVDKPPAKDGYHCPVDGSNHNVTVELDAAAVMKAAFAKAKPPTFVVGTTTIQAVSKPSEPKDKGKA